MAPQHDAEFENAVKKFLGVSPFKGDRINRSRRNLAVIGSGSGYRSISRVPNFSLLGQLAITVYLTAAAENSSSLKIRLQ